MTIKEVLNAVVKDLSCIRIPISEIDNIGQSITRSVNNLKICISAMDQAEKEAMNQAEKEAHEKAEQDNIVQMKSQKGVEDGEH